MHSKQRLCWYRFPALSACPCLTPTPTRLHLGVSHLNMPSSPLLCTSTVPSTSVKLALTYTEQRQASAFSFV